MSANGRARDGRARAIGASGGAAILVAGLVAGCGSPPTPPPSAAPTSSPSMAPTATRVAYADTLRVGWNGGPPTDQTTAYPLRNFRGLLPTTQPTSISFASVVYSALYRYDAHYNAIPDLADGPCQPQADPKVIRCRLIETTFHDGTALTADDVVSSYQLWLAAEMTGSLKEITAVDPRTVDFVLSAVDPTFPTEVLPGNAIFPRRDLEARAADFAAATKDLTSEGLTKLADTIDEELGRDPKVCAPRVDEVNALFARIGATFYPEDFPDASGAFDPCAFMQTASYLIRLLADYGVGQTGESGVLGAFLNTAWFRPPVGTGPYRLVSESGDSVRLDAFAGYHGGSAATEYLDFVPTKPDGSDVEAGAVDVFQWADIDSAYRVSAAAHGVQVVNPPANGYLALFFNVRPGRLFADRSLRQALQLCIDLPRDVDAATGGGAIVTYGPVLPGSWADDPGLPKPLRDTAVAGRLIEAAGWRLGTDGVYAKDGVRLAADIVVRAGKADRIKMADLIGAGARDCGMDLTSRPEPWGDIWPAMLTYPHDIPRTATPFDLYIGGWSNGPDPADGLDAYLSANVSDEAHPDNSNFGGFADSALDRLIEAGKATYDQAERTRIYRAAQEELAAQLPVIFLWNGWSGYDAVRSAVTTVDGPLDLAAPNWAWQPERIVVAASP